MPANFATKLGDNKHLFNRLFSSETKTGGGTIDELVYMPEQLKAIITYNQECVAQNVLNKKEIAYCDHVFRVKNCVEIAYTPPNESTTEQIEPRPRAQSLNCRKLLLKGVKPTKTSSDVHRMAYFVTKLNPVSSELKNAIHGEWLLSFKENLDFAVIEQMFKKKSLEAGLSYEVVYAYSEADSSPCVEALMHLSVTQPANLFQHGSSDKQLVLANVPRFKKVTDVERYAFMLTKLLVLSAEKLSELHGTWLCTFAMELG